MTTFFPFTPTGVAPFSFKPTLDGQEYQAVVTWSLFGQRYYISIYTLNQVLIVYLPVVGCPTGMQIENLSWDVDTSLVTATTLNPHGFNLAETIELTIAGATPTAYNGLFPCLITGPNEFTYTLAADPGQATVFGSVSYLINLMGGYFNSTLVFRNNQFEVSP
jgi:hypothetical protein